MLKAWVGMPDRDDVANRIDGNEWAFTGQDGPRRRLPLIWILVALVSVGGAAGIVAVRVGGPSTVSEDRGEPASRPDPMSPIREDVQDREAQSDLRNALAAARAYYTDWDSYRGFSLRTARSFEPTLIWSGDAPASPGVVTINYVRGSRLVMSTRSESGRAFCIADEARDVTFGTRDAVGATSPRDCGTKKSTDADWLS